MRRPRIKADGAGFYHGMSRCIERRHVFGPKEKERFLALMRNLAACSGLDILTYALVELIALELQDFRRQGQDQGAEALKARFTYRMYEVSEFFKALKQRFSPKGRQKGVDPQGGPTNRYRSNRSKSRSRTVEGFVCWGYRPSWIGSFSR